MSSATHNNISGAALTLAGVVAMQSSLAAPPLHPQWQIQSQTRPQSSVQTRPQTPAQTPAPQHLDLRAPSHMPEMADEAADRSFPSRRPKLSAQDAPRLPELGGESGRVRPTVQEFVRRVHREGLPVARLFEGKSALVHLGFNPKGKPGLWLVQKTR